MKLSTKIYLLLLTLTASIIWMQGCKKTNSSPVIPIVGTWNYLGYIAGFTNIDTLFPGLPSPAPGICTLRFTTDGHFTYTQSQAGFRLFFDLDTSSNISGTYYHSGDTLIFYDYNKPTVPFYNKVSTLNDTSLILVQEDSVLGLNFQLQSYFTK